MNRTVKTLATLAVLAFSPALAQWNYVNTMAIANMQTMITNAYDIQRLNRVIGSSGSSQGSQTTNRPQAQAAAPQTNFRPGQQRLLVQQFSRSLSTDPAVVRQLNTAFTEGFKAFEDEAKRLGKPNNVAMALTYLIGVCYMVHYGEEPSEAALMNLQAKTDMALGESLKGKPDRERQTLYEALVLMATLPLMGYTVAAEEKDQALMDTYREIAGVALESALGIRPERLKFTATGLEMR
jgi:hypothetical protein